MSINRWTKRKKFLVLDAIERGVMTREEAKAAYSITEEELIGWFFAYHAEGVSGLRATRRIKQWA